MENFIVKLHFYRKNIKTEFTRMCIAEAIVELLKETEPEKIRISAVVKKAGVSRMTFYNNYNSITDALNDYLQIIIGLYIDECNKTPDIGGYLEYSHILYSLNFFDKYRTYFVTMAKCNLHSVMLNAINQFMLNQFPSDTPFSVYERYCYAGGLLNAFLKWEENKTNEKAEDIAALICKLYSN